jgi:hypothetical protein
MTWSNQILIDNNNSKFILSLKKNVNRHLQYQFTLLVQLFEMEQ